jgi:hypothetical protein
MRWVSERGVALLAVLFAAGRSEGTAFAQDYDPSHGRVDGDLTVVAGLGAAVAERGASAEGEIRLRYLESAGVFAAYEEGALFDSSAQPQRLLATGLELRPLFLARWLQGYETPSARLDLTLDSIGLELGAVFAQRPGGPFGSEFGVQLGLGVEIPLLERATGPWIGVHGGVRWSDAALASGSVRGPMDRTGFLVLTLAWHQLLVTHIVDLGDRAPR